MQLQIRESDLTEQKVIALLQNHLEDMKAITPPESIHALDLRELKSSALTFWTAWYGDDLVGCGALKELDSNSGEIKSMRTVKLYRRRGIASKMLEHIIKEAQKRGYDCLNLETGALPEFAPARALYDRHGFEYRSPFAEYINDPNSVFMMKRL